MNKPKYVHVVNPKELSLLIEHSGQLNYPLLVVINQTMWAEHE
jgi:hypothetical protein